MCEPENGYTFRMGDHEVTMRDSFSSMFDQRQLTDCLLVCTQSNQTNSSSPNTNTNVTTASVTDNALNDTESGGTGSAAANSANNSLSGNGSSQQLTNGHNSMSRSVLRNEWSNSRYIKTHRVILSASSDFFRSIFASINTWMSNSGVVAVVINNVDFDDLDAIVEFIYKGQVSVGQSRIHKFLAAAQMLSVKGLMNIKLVSNDNTPIEETNAHDIEMNRLKQEKRLLEQELKAVRENEKQKMERYKLECEEHLNKKFDSEKKALAEAKKKIEFDRNKLNGERESFEKNRKLVSRNENAVNDNKESYRQIDITESSRVSVDESKTETITNNTEHQTRVTSRESPLKCAPPSTTPVRVNTVPQPQSQQTSITLKSPSVPPESPSVQQQITSEPESEGRQLRRRVRNVGSDDIANLSDSSEKLQRKTRKIDEDEDGEIYEIDFSSGFNQVSSASASVDTEARPRFSSSLNTSNSSTSSRAIVASTVASYLSTPASVTVPSNFNNKRILRRSVSSQGSASVIGENGNDSSAVNDTPGLPANQRRKGPGRTPTWMKAEGMSQDVEYPPVIVESPRSGARKRFSADSDSTGRSSNALYQCPYCPQVYHGNQSMQDHINGIHLNTGQKYICDFCGKVYTWRISLNKHLRSVHPNEEITS